MKKFYTIDDLYSFCKENNFSHFSAKEHNGVPLIVSSIETFEVEDNSKDGLLPVKLRSCHIGRNRNGSSISEETMKKYMSSFKGRPILGSIIKTDTGEYEFHSHDAIINEDNELEYVEQPVGVVSQIEEPYLEYNSEMDKTYLMVSGYIFENYTRAAEILQRRKTCRCSVELAIEDMSWNAKENYLSIDSFYFAGVTILGTQQDGVTEIEEGMLGSKITINDFQANKNFEISYQAKLVETLEKLNDTLSTFAIDKDKTDSKTEGGSAEMGHFNELLNTYGITEEDIDFEIEEGISDEELDALFEEHFGCNKKKKCNMDEDGTETQDNNDSQPNEEDEKDEEETETSEDEEIDDSNGDGSPRKLYSINENGDYVVSFEISHDDIRYALYQLIQVYDDEDNDWYFIRDVYDNYFYMQGCCNARIFKQSYLKDEDNVTLSGDRQEMFEMILSESEKLSIEDMRKNYASLKEFKDNYDAKELKVQKDAIFNNEKFNVLKDNDAFNTLKINADKYSVDEINEKVKVIFADYIMENGAFELSESKNNGMKNIRLMNPKPNKRSAYGNLFDN